MYSTVLLIDQVSVLKMSPGGGVNGVWYSCKRDVHITSYVLQSCCPESCGIIDARQFLRVSASPVLTLARMDIKNVSACPMIYQVLRDVYVFVSCVLRETLAFCCVPVGGRAVALAVTQMVLVKFENCYISKRDTNNTRADVHVVDSHMSSSSGFYSSLWSQTTHVSCYLISYYERKI